MSDSLPTAIEPLEKINSNIKEAGGPTILTDILIKILQNLPTLQERAEYDLIPQYLEIAEQLPIKIKDMYLAGLQDISLTIEKIMEKIPRNQHQILEALDDVNRAIISGTIEDVKQPSDKDQQQKTTQHREGLQRMSILLTFAPSRMTGIQRGSVHYFNNHDLKVVQEEAYQQGYAKAMENMKNSGGTASARFDLDLGE